ncbi:hypothetical protein N5C66_17100 [Rhizobium pusense]|uniref:Uncharacterized protein n=1 Tax=Agrobacterium genomosp. 2 str. CFBP 5494 TaxID=1183436 RepID=A0A9W5B180_9HYPH|nr:MULTISPECIES: hypothetical protein [Rhizobium/Agrobacterium group]HCJ73273.1 hypothetical protein [Agrobacterium sp.]MDH0910827.1 hypothetical protein [Agrobacterium pusense]MDH1097582.1 hypothetical protein [Agrobacterium pusense]MDH1113455.1 hypothetical protein [Agrobacterium pusense]MDH2195862.1 hypothetical protein [Agrobacterium pusense]
MKKLVITGVALLIAAGSGFAQQPPPPPPGPADTSQSADAPPPPPPPGPGGPKEAGWRGGPHGKRMPPPPSKAAHFRIEDGERKIDVKCADDEPMKACADIMMQIIDKMNE